MNTEYFHGFVTLAECKNFSVARNKLYISQPALTKQIKKLEQEIGSELFIRNTRSIELTETGYVFLKYAKLICDLEKNMHMEIDSRIFNQYKQLRIGYITNTHKPLIENALEGIYLKHDDIDVSITQDMPPQIIEMLRLGQLDCAVLHLPSVLGEADIEYLTVKEGGICARISDKNPLSRQDSISLSDIEDMEILLSAKTCPKCHEYTNRAFINAGVTPKWHTVNSIESVEMLTKARDMISFTSEYNTASRGIAMVPVREMKTGFDIVFAYIKGNRNPYIKQLYKNIIEDL